MHWPRWCIGLSCWPTTLLRALAPSCCRVSRRLQQRRIAAGKPLLHELTSLCCATGWLLLLLDCAGHQLERCYEPAAWVDAQFSVDALSALRALPLALLIQTIVQKIQAGFADFVRARACKHLWLALTQVVAFEANRTFHQPRR